LIEGTVGPSIEIRVHCDPALWPTKIDGAQLENSLLNLCINARDAMPEAGGDLTVKSSNVVIDDALAAEYDIPPGDYVSLAVMDTGSGMPPEVIERAFDPFFTTKPLGQGTGLGLSMVYGFARQSGGHVRVRSSMGVGTTMEMLLPRFGGVVPAVNALIESRGQASGEGEKILVVEDEETIRVLMAEMLEECGFQPITAEHGQAALKILRSGIKVDLLVTDVGLPGGMNGRQVADAAREIKPGLKVLFVTGYAVNAAIRDGRLERGMEVLTKPFEFPSLIAKIREMIEA
jgi:CheY-like chemotaxis protein